MAILLDEASANYARAPSGIFLRRNGIPRDWDFRPARFQSLANEMRGLVIGYAKQASQAGKEFP